MLNGLQSKQKKKENRKILLYVIVYFSYFASFAVISPSIYNLTISVLALVRKVIDFFEMSRIFACSVISHLDCFPFLPGMMGSFVYSGTVHPQEATA